jgi:hypothetical protein
MVGISLRVQPANECLLTPGKLGLATPTRPGMIREDRVPASPLPVPPATPRTGLNRSMTVLSCLEFYS